MTESFPTDWDIDKYKDKTELKHHWLLRKKFMNEHKDKFPEEYLVALGRVFTNMEFLGCSYPAPVMRRVNELSKDVAKSYRNERKNKLKRTFVTASNAAENKIKRRTEPQSSTRN